MISCYHTCVDGADPADPDHLVSLPSADAALTRRARTHSTLAAVVLKWSQARKQYERQGLLAEEQALENAETECLKDSETRARHRAREAERRTERDPVQQEEELTELLGSCLWDVFSDNHDVITADGHLADIGSFRGASAFLDEHITGSARGTRREGDCMRSISGRRARIRTCRPAIQCPTLPPPS